MLFSVALAKTALSRLVGVVSYLEGVGPAARHQPPAMPIIAAAGAINAARRGQEVRQKALTLRQSLAVNSSQMYCRVSNLVDVGIVAAPHTSTPHVQRPPLSRVG